MPKRFTITEKWNDEWFISLSPQAKVIWEYIRDNCDLSGVFEVNVELLRFRIKFSSQVDIWKHLMELNEVAKKLGLSNRVEWFEDKKRLWIVNFIKVQFGELSENSSTHRGVFKVIKTNHLLKGLPNSYPTIKNHNKDKVKIKEKKEVEESESARAKKAVIQAVDVNELARNAVNDVRWVENTCIGHVLTREELIKWLGQYNTSLIADEKDFSIGDYKKMFGGWLNRQKAKGYKLPEKEKQLVAPVDRLN